MPDTTRRAESVIVPLLGSDDPPPFELVNEAGSAPVLVLCDHASRAIPRALDGLGLDEADRARHIAWDNGAAQLARELARRLDAPLVLAGYSRLVIDCNRALDDPTSIPLISETTVVPRNRGIAPGEAKARAEACFHPYHRTVAQLLDRFAARAVVPAILSVHSFTPVYKGVARPWHVGILWNRDPRIPVPLIAALERLDGVVVGDNLPYSGRDEYGYTTETHAAARGLPHVLIELRDDLVRRATDVAGWAERLVTVLTPILADPGVRRIERF
ncbi:MAG: N-formylglutamate amidohydrolase [Alphaproteobacteria bacterium]